MPRPGYEPEDGWHIEDDLQGLLYRLAPEARAILQEQLESGRITQVHVLQAYRLMSADPEARDPDAAEQIAQTAAAMDAEAFTDWVTNELRRTRDM